MGKRPEAQFRVKPKTMAIILIVIGIVVYISSDLLLNLVPNINAKDLYVDKSLKYIFSAILNILKLLAGVLISSGFISLLLEISTINNIVFGVYDSIIKKVLNADLDLTNYSEERLDYLQKKALIQKYKINSSPEDLNNSVYSLEKYLAELVLGLYHDYHKVTYWITPDEKEQIFRKRVKW